MSNSIEDFAAVASNFPNPFRLMVRDELGSTNDEVRILAEAGAPSGLVLLAHKQTAGRGRRGADWFSPANESLAFSILIRPKETKALWSRLALASGLAVAEAVECFGPAVGIKWPNDVWIGRRKVAGILVEAGEDYAIVGMGLNVNTTAFPKEVADIATSLKIETNQNFSRSELLAAIIRRFSIRCEQIGKEFDEVLDHVRERCVLSGHLVSLITSGAVLTGTVHGISPGGALQLRTTEGIKNLLQADEVRILDWPLDAHQNPTS